MDIPFQHPVFMSKRGGFSPSARRKWRFSFLLSIPPKKTYSTYTAHKLTRLRIQSPSRLHPYPKPRCCSAVQRWCFSVQQCCFAVQRWCFKNIQAVNTVYEGNFPVLFATLIIIWRRKDLKLRKKNNGLSKWITIFALTLWKVYKWTFN